MSRPWSLVLREAFEEPPRTQQRLEALKAS